MLLEGFSQNVNHGSKGKPNKHPLILFIFLEKCSCTMDLFSKGRGGALLLQGTVMKAN